MRAYIGHQVELSVAWQATAELNLSASLSAFEAGTFHIRHRAFADQHIDQS